MDSSHFSDGLYATMSEQNVCDGKCPSDIEKRITHIRQCVLHKGKPRNRIKKTVQLKTFEEFSYLDTAGELDEIVKVARLSTTGRGTSKARDPKSSRMRLFYFNRLLSCPELKSSNNTLAACNLTHHMVIAGANEFVRGFLDLVQKELSNNSEFPEFTQYEFVIHPTFTARDVAASDQSGAFKLYRSCIQAEFLKENGGMYAYHCLVVV